MTIIRRRHHSRFAALPNAIWEDERISADEKGVLGYLLSRPPTWNVHLSAVAKTMKVGKDRIQRIFRTLIAAGYVTREVLRDENGVIRSLEYIVRDDPDRAQHLAEAASDATSTEVEVYTTDPEPENPAPVKPAAGRAAAYKEMKILNTDYTKPSCLPASSTAARARPSIAAPTIRAETLQSQIAKRLGSGNEALGWELLCEMSSDRLDQLTAQQRCGRLTEEGLARIRLEILARRAA